MGIKPTNTGEPFWLFLSILCLPIEEQLEIIGGVPSKKDNSKISMHGTNADHLLWALEEYYNGWYDEIDENGPGEEIITLIQSGSFEQINYLESFVEGKSWLKIRSLAKEAIKQAKLEPWPINGTINFYEYIELQD